jgi:nucleotide-binding universal stress UspA family protein
VDAQEAVMDGPSLILAAVDGTDTSLHAAAYAVGLARRGGSRLVFLFVRGVGAAGLTSPMAIASLREGEDETFRELKQIATERAAALGVPATIVDQVGDPYHEIVGAAREHKADLIVVGASAGLAHKVAGSLGSRLIKARICPVLVVPLFRGACYGVLRTRSQGGVEVPTGGNGIRADPDR